MLIILSLLSFTICCLVQALSSGDGHNNLLLAIKSGKLVRLRTVLRRGMAKDLVNRPDSNGWTPLHFAVNFLRNPASVQMARLLLDNGANVETRDLLGRTPLHIAIASGANLNQTLILEMVRELVDKRGANVSAKYYFITDERDNPTATALFMALTREFVDVADYLISNGADVNAAEGKSGLTPIQITLVQHKFGEGQMGLNDAIRLIRAMLAQANVNAKDKNQKTALHTAAELNAVPIGKILLDAGADVNALATYADMEQVVKPSVTPLHAAANHGSVEMVQLLAERGADVHARDHLGRTALHLALVEKDPRKVLQIAKILLDKGADVNAEASGLTPLYLTVRSGTNNMALVKLLLEHGANITAATTKQNDETDPKLVYGRTPLHAAILTNNTELAKLLIERAKKFGQTMDQRDSEGLTPLHLAVINNKSYLVYLLLKNGANPNITDHDSWTPLHFAIRNDQITIADKLIQSGAFVDAVAKLDGVDSSMGASFITPMHLAVMYASADMVRMLLKHGADVERQNLGGRTPLHLAILSTSNQPEEKLRIVRVLVEQGHANISAKFRWITDDSLGAPVNEMDNPGLTPLMVALGTQNVDMVKMLLDSGANPKLGGVGSQFNILHLAAKNGNVEILKMLLARGANDPKLINAEDQNGNTPAKIAQENGHLEAAKLLEG